jgi:hypothetical protein
LGALHSVSRASVCEFWVRLTRSRIKIQLDDIPHAYAILVIFMWISPVVHSDFRV